MAAAGAIRSVVGMTTDTHSLPLDVLIAGGGVAALEAMMALRDARRRPRADHAAGARARLPLPPDGRRRAVLDRPRPPCRAVPIAADFDARVRRGALASVEPAERRVVHRATAELIAYDALVLACGTRMRPALDGALTIDDRTLGGTLRGLVQDVEEGYTHEIAFVAPAQAFWPLPLYELALHDRPPRLRHERRRSRSRSSAPRPRRWRCSAAGISDELARLLARRRHRLPRLVVRRVRPRRADACSPSGVELRPDRVVAMPLLEGPRIAGVPCDAHGFIAGRCDAARCAASTASTPPATSTSDPIKHGGIAAQQADVVAAAIAARAGVGVEPEPLRPVVPRDAADRRGHAYLEAELGGDERSAPR